jgi:hypothetical protein
MRGNCADCAAFTQLVARRLCGACYRQNKLARTLEQFPRLGPPSGGIPALDRISYRQLDFWIRQGYLQPEGGGRSGIARQWSEEEIAVLDRMISLVEEGYRPSAAARLARREPANR